MKNTFLIRVDGKWHRVWGCMTDTISHFVMPETPEDIFFGDNPPTIEKRTDSTKVFGNYTEAELHAAFDLVKNKKGWKEPVNCLVPNTVDVDAITAAISYFCGSPCDFRPAKGDKFRVTAPGYYICIGA